jgi:microcystin-dependent protein
MGLNYRKWSLWPPILSNVGTIINEIYVSGRLKINDLDEVTVENPINDQVLVYDDSVTQWKNENIGNILPPSPPTSLLDEIRMFGGDVNTVFPGGVGGGDYDGWYLCDGYNGTLDLRSRFVLGLGPGQYTDTIGFEGGVSEVTLTGEQSGMPAHSHTKGTLNITSSGGHVHGNNSTTNNVVEGASAPGSDIGDNGSEMKYTSFLSATHTHPSSSFSGDTGTRALMDASEAHTNIPPYTIVAFIQFKG